MILIFIRKSYIMLDPNKIVEQRKQKKQLKKERVEQAEQTSIDVEVINNSVSADSKLTGLQKIGSSVLKQSQKLSKFVIPLALNLIKEYGVEQLETALENNRDNIDSLRDELKDQFCNIQLPQIIEKRNNAVEYLNNIGKILDSLTLSINFGGSFVDVGGHSFMEAAAKAKTIIVGPYMYNFIEETEEFLKNNALIMCQKPIMLKNIFEKLFRSKSKREVFEKSAKKLVQEKSLIINDYLKLIDTHFKG